MKFCFTFLVILAVAIGFWLMFLFIRLTSFAGYKASKQSATAAAAAVTPPVTDRAWREEL